MASSLLAFALKKTTAPTVSSTLFTNLLRSKTPLSPAISTVSSFLTITSCRSYSSGGRRSGLPPHLPFFYSQRNRKMASSLLAFAFKKTTAPTVSSAPFTNLLRSKTPLSPAISTVSSFRTITSGRSFSSGGRSSDLPPHLPQTAFGPYEFCVLNPLQSAGQTAALTIKIAKDNKEHKTVIVDMSGVGPEGYKVWLDSKENALCVEGNVEPEVLMLKADNESSVRTCAVTIKLKMVHVLERKLPKKKKRKPQMIAAIF